jgi:hypothetical protein
VQCRTAEAQNRITSKFARTKNFDEVAATSLCTKRSAKPPLLRVPRLVIYLVFFFVCDVDLCIFYRSEMLPSKG